MTARRRPLLAALFVGLLSPLAVGTGQAAAPGKVKVGVDRKHAVSFSIDGRMIDVHLRPAAGGKPNRLVQKLSGAGIVVACKGMSPRRGRMVVADLETAWPAGQDLMRGKLSRDASDAMEWCVLEEPDGTDIAVTRKLRTPRPAATAE